MRATTSRERGGFALIAVVLVLAALLLLCTPFLLSARNSDQASQQVFSRAEADLALENALVHSRAVLRDSHYGRDETPFWDGLDELAVDNEFPADFLDARDARGLMWDASAEDVAGRIDLGSAPPQLLAAMTGGVTRLVQPITGEDTEIPVASVAGLEPAGFLWLGGELIHYGKIDGNVLTDLERGLGAQYDLDENLLPGPRPPSSHGVGATVLDQRAFAPAEWRLFEGDVRAFDSYERLREVDPFVLAEGGFGAASRVALRRLGSVHGGVAAGRRWQRAARMVSGGTRERTGVIRVDSVRWFNPGSTIRISDGQSAELAIVEAVDRSGAIRLDRALTFDYVPYAAEVRVLARRPVNVNTAPPEVLAVLLENLKLVGRNQRVTGDEARALAVLIAQSRPFDGLQDFLKRVVLPAAGIEALPGDAPVVPDAVAPGQGAIIDPFDAVAIYRNALNANDMGLEYSTMPFAFTSRDVYDLDLRCAVNAESGVERASAGRERTELIAPQDELLVAWGRQEDFDEQLRNTREAPYWMTGPNSTSRYDPLGSTPPTRMWAHLGTWEGQLYLPGVVGPTFNDPENTPTPEHVFADREPDGWAQPMAARVDDSADPELAGRVMHFDHETRDPEGRYLPDEVVRLRPTDQMVQWDSGTGLVRGFTFSCWVKPRSHADAVLLDVGSNSPDADRVSIAFEGGDLVLSVLDGGGDHRDTPQFEERTEVRYALAPGTGPGLPIDVWHHLAVDVRGSRPSQVHLLVNGLAHGVRTLGLTRLVAQIDESASTLPVESTEGFPDRGVVRIGDELIEYVKSGNALQAAFNAAGPDAGFGGRNARVRWSGGEPPLPLNVGATAFNHPLGAPVELYGYAQALADDVTAGQGALSGELGAFRVGVVTALAGAAPLGNSINVNGVIGSFPIGTGIDPALTPPTGLVIGVAEDPDGEGDASGVMAAFNPSGGYAALLQVHAGETTDGFPIGGWEVIRYSGWSDDVLQVAAWGDGVNELVGLEGADPDDGGGKRAWVVRWQAALDGVPIQEILGARLFIIPISVQVTGGASTFVSGPAGQPQFAAISEDARGELTEWVAYNTYVGGTGQLVRDDPLALNDARSQATGARPEVEPDDPTGGGGGGPGGGGGGGQIQGLALAPSAPRPAPTAPATAALGSLWEPGLGEPEDTDFPITRAVREAFLHRGVFDTYSHPHAVGTPVRPVFRVIDRGVDGGRPGKNDAVFVMGADFTHLGWPVTVQRGHQPSPQVMVHTWQQVADQVVAETTGQSFAAGNVGQGNVWYYALAGASPAPVLAGTVDPTGQANIVDTRAMARLLRFPSGERPRGVQEVRVGGAISSTAAVPSALVDELAFTATDAGTKLPLVDPESTQAPQLVLREDFYDGDALAVVLPNQARIPLGLLGTTYPLLSDLDRDAGLLRIGNEIVAYDAVDASTGEITIAQGGRGLLGTVVGNYPVGTTVTFLDGWRATTLAANVDGTTNAFPVESTDGFPGEGTLLVGRELVHYTRLQNGAFEMPAGSEEAGRMDRKGPGIFRGRYGTPAEEHLFGEPVILFPFRYWDRWSERADAPELAYFGLELDQPAAWHREFTFRAEEPGLAGVQLGVLMRTDPATPWDADPDDVDGLARFYQGEREDGWLPIGAQSDHVEWRAFVEYQQGAFDLVNGLAHGWRTTPRLKLLATTFIAPSMTLRSVER